MDFKLEGLDELIASLDKLSDNAEQLSEDGILISENATEEEIKKTIEDALFKDV